MHRVPMLVILAFLSLVLLVACGGEPTQPNNNTNTSPNVNPPIVEVVPEPELPPEQPEVLVFSPDSVGPCENAPAPALEVGERALIEADGLNLREEPFVPDGYTNIVRELRQDETVTVIDGVACAHGGYWWLVEADNGGRGWMRERDRSGRELLREVLEVDSP